MAMHPGFGLKGSTQDAIDFRLGEAGAIVRSATGVPRYGVFAPGVTGTGRSDMKIDVSPFTAFLGRGSAYGGVKSASDGTEPSPTFDAAPSSNSRIDVLWVRQNDSVDASNSDDLLVFGIAKGTAAGTPTAPSVPSGCIPLLDVKLPALAGSTDAANVTITPSAPFTVAAGGILPVRTKAELDAFTGGEGQTALQLDNMRLWVRRGGAWRRNGEKQSHAEFQFDRAVIGDGVTDIFSRSRIDESTNDEAFISMSTTSGNTLTFVEPGIYDISYQVAIVAATTAAGYAEIVSGGVTLARDTVSAPDNVLSAAVNGFVVLAANTTVAFRVRKTTGGPANILGRIRATRTGSFV